jgi:hypothetical protein
VALASSADGSKLVGLANGVIYTSRNSGTTWTKTSAPTNYGWGAVASSADGRELVATAADSSAIVIYTSTNSGTTWLKASAPTNYYWSTVASSADGGKLVAAANLYNGAYSGAIYTSTNSGIAWAMTSAPTNFPWSYVASSADGTKLVAVASETPDALGTIYLSTNSGVDWVTTSSSAKTWRAVACSADGAKVVAVSYANGIYTLQTTPEPLLRLRSAKANAVLSWIIPSMDFNLQENSDLTTTNWTDVPTPPVLNLTNLQNQVIVSPPGGNTFYRLKH